MRACDHIEMAWIIGPSRSGCRRAVSKWSGNATTNRIGTRPELSTAACPDGMELAQPSLSQVSTHGLARVSSPVPTANAYAVVRVRACMRTGRLPTASSSTQLPVCVIAAHFIPSARFYWSKNNKGLHGNRATYAGSIYSSIIPALFQNRGHLAFKLLIIFIYFDWKAILLPFICSLFFTHKII